MTNEKIFGKALNENELDFVAGGTGGAEGTWDDGDGAEGSWGGTDDTPDIMPDVEKTIKDAKDIKSDMKKAKSILNGTKIEKAKQMKVKINTFKFRIGGGCF